MTNPSDSPIVMRFGRVGDMVLQSVLLHLLARRYGQPCTLVSSGPWSRELFGSDPAVGKVHSFRFRHSPFALNPEHWWLAIRLRRSSGPVYVSEDIPRQQQKAMWLLDHAGVASERCVFLPEQDSPAHWIDRLNAFGAETPIAWRDRVRPIAADDCSRAARLVVSPAEQEGCLRWLAAHGLSGRPLVLIQAGNRRSMRLVKSRGLDSKAWPIENWAVLVRFIRQRMRQAHILLCGVPTEESLLREIRARAGVDRVIIATRKMPLVRLKALALFAHSMIAVDSGPAHIAAAVGCPLVVLYGAEPIAIWRRRSQFDAPILELGGAPECKNITEISTGSVMEAWSTVVTAVAGMRPANFATIARRDL